MHRGAHLMKLLGSVLVVGLFASNCVVKEGDDDDACEPGTSDSCTCADGRTGTRSCLPTGDDWAACSCSSASGGSGNSGGSAGNGSGGQSSGGTYGNAGEGGASTGGTAGAGEGGASTGGMAGAGDGGMSQGGAGGADNEFASCEECAQVACEPEWTACDVEGTTECAEQIGCLLPCMELERMDLEPGTRLANEQITETCVDDCGINAGWPGGASEQTQNLLNCLAGKNDWDTTDPPHWGESPCPDACFGPLP